MTTCTVELRDIEPFTIDDAPWAGLDPGPQTPARLVFAAAHIVLDDQYADASHPDQSEVIAEHIDWTRTLEFRRHLAAHGFGIAEAMDTAQRFEIGWTVAQELIRRCAALNLETGFVAGAGSDQLSGAWTAARCIDAVVEQVNLIQGHGGIPMILPTPALSLNDAGPDEYVAFYRAIIEQCDGPILIHWLGPMFLDALEGYFPGDSFDRIMALDPTVVRGTKLSMLDADLEHRVRHAARARDQIVLTGDDYNFASLIRGAPAATQTTIRIGAHTVAFGDFSHALLGIFDGIAAPAGVALRCLAAGDIASYDRIMGPCEELSRAIFAPPTSAYKVGLALLSWLNGHQPNRLLVNRLEQRRSTADLARVAALAAAAGALTNAELAADRLALLDEAS